MKQHKPYKPWVSERATKLIFGAILFGMFVAVVSSAQRAANDPQAVAAAAKELAALSDEVFKREAFGCKDWDTWQSLGHVVAQGDKEAFAKILYPALALGTCRRFKPGDHAYLSKSAAFSGSACMRPKGEVECFWVSSDATGKP